MSELKALKKVYEKLGKNYDSAKHFFYDTENKDFRLIASTECLTIAECKIVIANQIMEELEKGE